VLSKFIHYTFFKLRSSTSRKFPIENTVCFAKNILLGMNATSLFVFCIVCKVSVLSVIQQDTLVMVLNYWAIIALVNVKVWLRPYSMVTSLNQWFALCEITQSAGKV